MNIESMAMAIESMAINTVTDLKDYLFCFKRRMKR